jgi:hypothetical protein
MSTSSYNDNGPAPSIPLADEANPGLGSRSRIVEDSRRVGGELDDSSDPVRDDLPYKITHG